MLRGPLSRIDRCVALALAVTCLVAGLAGFAAGLIHAMLPLLVLSALVVVWGAVWTVIAWRGHLLGSPRRRR